MKHKSTAHIVIAGILLLTCACKRSDNFYHELVSLPQIDYTAKYAYKPAYVVGDTMAITGSFKPINTIQVNIGNVNARIIKADSVIYNPDNATTAFKQRIFVLITQAMEGLARQVKVSNNGNSVQGASVDIYSTNGPGSLTDSIKSVQIKSLTGARPLFLYAVNGKGDIYYYSGNDKSLHRISKTGDDELIVDLSGSLDISTTVSITNFLAGGVDPQEKNLYFSAITNRGYRLLSLDLATKQITTLNQSTGIGAPFEGNISNVKMVANAIYPDAEGNLFLGIGLEAPSSNNKPRPDAIAVYRKNTQSLSYVFKSLRGINGNDYQGMPGIKLDPIDAVQDFRCNPDEHLLYVLETRTGAMQISTIELYDLNARIQIQNFTSDGTVNSNSTRFNFIGPFSSAQITFTPGRPDFAFGYLPMPGKRLQVLLYQYIDGSVINMGTKNVASQFDFPRWATLNFSERRIYNYAPGRFNANSGVFMPSVIAPGNNNNDELLNYDSDGNLYMSLNGKAALIKTQSIH